MTENEQKQQLSIALVHAIAAWAGFACQATLVDDDSVDVAIGAKGYIHHQSKIRSPRLELQLKATAQDALQGDHITYSLPVKNYNELREEAALPRLVVVLFLPEDPNLWLESSEECMISRRCAYWLSLLGMQETSNTRTVTVRLPRAQLFSVDSLRGLMERASRKEAL